MLLPITVSNSFKFSNKRGEPGGLPSTSCSTSIFSEVLSFIGGSPLLLYCFLFLAGGLSGRSGFSWPASLAAFTFLANPRGPFRAVARLAKYAGSSDTYFSTSEGSSLFLASSHFLWWTEKINKKLK